MKNTKLFCQRGAAEGEACGSCGCAIAILICNLLLGGVTVNYCLESFIGKTVDFVWAAIAGLFLGEISLPLAVVCWLLRICGLHTPFVHQ